MAHNSKGVNYKLLTLKLAGSLRCYKPVLQNNSTKFKMFSLGDEYQTILKFMNIMKFIKKSPGLV